eukprot:TRINITY_DN16195_c0_g1_i1.p1 TRINITY_DN16195_c0_g1~~TRINITY_DN16195_c0_g1_i1.p1  ORF type:complete len:160 (+),score=34.51 TRINITY_DN16195_c0_g1_i1:79-558(+)
MDLTFLSAAPSGLPPAVASSVLVPRRGIRLAITPDEHGICTRKSLADAAGCVVIAGAVGALASKRRAGRASQGSRGVGQVCGLKASGEAMPSAEEAFQSCRRLVEEDPEAACASLKDEGELPSQSRKVCSAAALISSVKAQCIHPEREDPMLCGDCPRN